MDKNNTPEFTGRFEKIRDHWPAFVANKTSERSKKMSATNKINDAKKEHYHRMGSVATSKPGRCGTRLSRT